MPSFFQNSADRKWLLMLVTIILFFALLIYCTWLYYSYRLKKLDHQQLLLLPTLYQATSSPQSITG